MSQGGYLAIAISILAVLGVLALLMFLYLRKGPRVERKKCADCADLTCPVAKALEEKR